MTWKKFRVVKLSSKVDEQKRITKLVNILSTINCLTELMAVYESKVQLNYQIGGRDGGWEWWHSE
jgi:hypothetical protein